MGKINESVTKQTNQSVGIAKILHDNYLYHVSADDVVVFDKAVIGDIMKYVKDQPNYNRDEYFGLVYFFDYR